MVQYQPGDEVDLGGMAEALRAVTSEMETMRRTVAELVTVVALLEQRFGQQDDRLAELAETCKQGFPKRAVGAAGAGGAGVTTMIYGMYSWLTGG
jgi:hypothetical protein